MSTDSLSPSRGSHFTRIATIAVNTFTQLVRMKVFYFLAPFALLPIAANFFDLQELEGPASVGVNVLRSIKNWSFGAMFIYANVLAVVATALLLPKDVEDRTLYTILAKPVPRFDYLVGKLLGVISLLFFTLLVMDLLMVGVLSIRTEIVVSEQLAMSRQMGFPDESLRVIESETRALGPSWALQAAVLSIFLKAIVIASLAMLVSTFSTSTLFTAIVGFLMFAIGHFQAYARDFYLQSGDAGQTLFTKLIALIFTLIIPDFQIFNVADGYIENPETPLMVTLKLIGMAFYYCTFFILAAWYLFSDKEI